MNAIKLSIQVLGQNKMKYNTNIGSNQRISSLIHTLDVLNITLLDNAILRILDGALLVVHGIYNLTRML